MQVTASAQSQCMAQAQGAVGQPFVLQVPNANLWSPDNPFLYDLEVQLLGAQQGMVSVPRPQPWQRYPCSKGVNSIGSSVLVKVH